MQETNKNRRGFLKKSALASLGLLIGADIVHGAVMPAGYTPIWLSALGPLPDGKHPDLKILNDRPWNLETPAHLLDDKITPADRLFVRNNGLVPEKPDVKKWTLTIRGESALKTKVYTIADLKSKFKHHTYQLVLECAGNGRSQFNPPAKGVAWGNGAVGCVQWTGVRLRDILQDVGIKPDAVYIGYEGKDTHLSGNFEKKPISRGVPIEKAMEDETLIAWSMNGKDIPIMHGYPLRLVVGGWSASVSGKWLSDILVRNKVHDGEKMKPPSYSMPCEPVAPGEDAPPEKQCILAELPVKSLITYPKNGGILTKRNTLEVRGHAWTGLGEISKVEVSTDFGVSWQTCTLERAANRFAWAQWKQTIQFPSNGYYEVWARATDTQGNIQPVLGPAWNPKGYYNNACHRIALKVNVS
jgi:sulfite oxidase